MAKVEISPSLYNEINKIFKKQSTDVFKHLKTLEDYPKKGKLLCNVGGIVLKELKYRNYRFYFITEGHKLNFFEEKELINLLIRFVKMSDKKNQQKTIEEIKLILKKIGSSGFN